MSVINEIKELCGMVDAVGDEYFARDPEKLHLAVSLLLAWVAEQSGAGSIKALATDEDAHRRHCERSAREFAQRAVPTQPTPDREEWTTFAYRTPTGDRTITLPKADSPTNEFLTKEQLGHMMGRKDIVMVEDGSYALWPARGAGFYSSHDLRRIANTIDKLNAPWDQQVHSDLDKAAKQQEQADLSNAAPNPAIGFGSVPEQSSMADALSDTWALIANAWGGNWPDRNDAELGKWTRDAEAWRTHWLTKGAQESDRARMLYESWKLIGPGAEPNSRASVSTNPDWRKAYARWYKNHAVPSQIAAFVNPKV